MTHQKTRELAYGGGARSAGHPGLCGLAAREAYAKGHPVPLPLCPRCRMEMTEVLSCFAQAATVVRGRSVRAMCRFCGCAVDVEVIVELSFKTTETRMEEEVCGGR